jgi:Nif-specific regulatory protein
LAKGDRAVITLTVVQGEARGRVFELGQSAIVIGRAQEATIALGDYHLSHEHGQILLEDERYIYRDLRSTNGSMVLRGAERIVLSADRSEVVLRDGDRLLLGDPAQPVILACRVPESDGGPPPDDPNERVIAQRPRAALEEVAGRVELDPASTQALYRAVKQIGGRLELEEVLDAVADAVFTLLPRATHVVIQLGEDETRFTTVLLRARGGSPGSAGRGGEAPPLVRMPVVPPVANVGDTLRPGDSLAGAPKASRAVLRRVLHDRAALIVANAVQELGGTESIMAAKILSTVAVPMWDGDRIAGVIQADNRLSSGIFREQDLELLMLLGQQSLLAIENARLYRRLKTHEEQLRGEVKYLKTREERRRFADIIGESSAMRAIFQKLEKVIDTRATVCIEGETGTGKELVASAIHYQGRRREKLFVAQNCASLPETLLESELFGHKKGAFTGADHDKKGLFELADGGTLFLDEIGEMPLGLQAKLLRVLQEGEVRPLGSAQTRKVDVRIICATNRDLAREVEGSRFRQDLYYRLMVFPVKLPPLRERREDIPELVAHFMRRYTSEMKKPIAGVSQPAMDLLQAYAWPGNVRELENEVQRLVIQVETDAFVEPEDLSPQLRKVEGVVTRIAPKQGTLKDMMDEIERHLLTEALRQHGGNKTKTAETLGITREGLHKKLAKFGL